METPGDPRPPRIPDSGDLVTLCRELNARGARYVVIGGLAMAQQGLVRATEDVDLLIEQSRENQRKVRDALECLPDKAVREMTDDDLDNFEVVRVADEIVVDLMLAACGVTYADAESGVETMAPCSFSRLFVANSSGSIRVDSCAFVVQPASS